ncbi:MAG: ca2+ sensor protein [Sphingomonas phyllosphaerae]|uniref:ca2+ sensor protein n=1 Tax=Sphingomonas phyllosphaerae TaxID=257003 RepID=UPI002FFC7D5C
MKTWITAAALGAAVLGGLGAASVQAQSMPAPPAGSPPAPMQMPDGDSDGLVTRDEAAADADRRFAAMDANHDGKLTRDERRAWREQRRAPPPGDRMGGPERRPRRDVDQTQAEFRDRALKRFDRIDTNHDGRIDAKEREAMMLMMRARGIGHGRPHDGPMPPADDAGPTG